MGKVERPKVRPDGLQLEEHRNFQERVWTAERVAWAAFAVILLAALAGLTGAGGPVSRASASLSAGTIDYPRFARWEDADMMTVTFAPGNGERSVTLSPAFADAFQIEDIQPEPANSEARPEGERLVFDIPDGAGARVTIHMTAHGPGILSYSAAIDDAEASDLLTIIWP